MLTKQILFGLAVSLLVAAAGAVALPPDEQPEGKLAITDSPLTVSIEPTDELRAGLAAAAQSPPKAAIRLTIAGVVPPPRRDLIEGVSVFVNKIDATKSTSARDPHFVAAFTFAPADGRDPENINLDLTRSLVALGRQNQLDLTRPLKITLLAIPVEGVKEFPKGFSVPVGKVTVTVVNLPK